MVAGIVEAMAGQVERALKQQEEKMTRDELDAMYADMNNHMAKEGEKTEEQKWDDLVWASRRMGLKDQNQPKPTKANDRQVGGEFYKQMEVEPWDVVDAGSYEQAIGYYRWSALAYIMRAGDKGPAREDYEKALHYLEKLLEIL